MVSRCSTVPVHPLARAPYRPGLDSRWGSIPPGSAPASLRSLWCPAAASGRCVTAEFRWGSSRVSHRLRRRRAAVSLPSRLICPRSRGHVRSRRRELRPSFNPAADFLQPCRTRWICPLRICSAMPSATRMIRDWYQDRCDPLDAPVMPLPKPVCDGDRSPRYINQYRRCSPLSRGAENDRKLAVSFLLPTLVFDPPAVVCEAGSRRVLSTSRKPRQDEHEARYQHLAS